MRVFIDLDGIVADLVAGLMGRYDKPWPFAEIRGEEAWNVDRIWGMTPEEMWGGLGYVFWAGLPKTREADTIVAILSQAFGVQNLCFLSHPVATHGCADGKRQWVRMYYPHIPVLLACCTGDGRSPKEFLAGDNTLLVDDHTPNVERFREAGGEAFLFPRQWNWKHAQEHEGVEQLLSFVQGFWSHRNFTYTAGVST